jgi:uncharacterized protein YceH (UPF0502 family)
LGFEEIAMADNVDTSVSWPILSLMERRLLGVMVEKAKTTPENYPMSVNALMTGSNQKSNRDPVLNLTEEDVEETLTGLQQKGLATRITGGRVERWRHNLYDHWTADKVEIAILAELLLRGAQTEGELRGRAARMVPINDLDALRQVLRPMAERKLVVFLGPEGRRGTLITHGFHAPAELEKLRAGATREEVEPSPMPMRSHAAPGVNWEQVVAELRGEIAGIQEQLKKVLQEHQTLRDEFRTLKGSLGG